MIEGPMIRLRVFTVMDVLEDHYLAWMRDPDVTRYMVAGRKDQDKDILMAYFEAHQWPKHLFLAVETLAGRHIGNVQLGSISWLDKRAEIGVMIGEKEEWGKGLGTEAVGLVCQIAFDRLGLVKLTAGFVAKNLGSGGVFFKNGFMIEGVYRAHFWLEDSLHDVVRVARFRESEGESEKAKVPCCRSWKYRQETREDSARYGARRNNFGSCPPRGRGSAF